ncbi:MAG: Clp1/GlmU family protein [Syntrophobacterales bacterium]
MSNKPEDIPPEWEQLELAGLSGTLMIVGPADVGKSTFSRYLFKRLCDLVPHVGYLDGDPGQSTLGPPGTMTLAVAENKDNTFPPRGRMWRGFVGSVSPVGHMLAVLTCAARLVGAAREAGVQAVIFDTTGLVDPARGGIYLKLAKIDLLRPAVLFAMQRQQELEALLMPLRRSRRTQLVELSPSPAAQRRDVSVRKAHRATQFGHYFTGASQLRVNWTQFAVLPAPRFNLHRLVAMEDAFGFTLGLGIVLQIDRRYRQVTLHSPLPSLDGVDAIRLSDVTVDPATFEDRHLP